MSFVSANADVSVSCLVFVLLQLCMSLFWLTPLYLVFSRRSCICVMFVLTHLCSFRACADADVLVAEFQRFTSDVFVDTTADDIVYV